MSMSIDARLAVVDLYGQLLRTVAVSYAQVLEMATDTSRASAQYYEHVTKVFLTRRGYQSRSKWSQLIVKPVGTRRFGDSVEAGVGHGR